MSAASRPVFIFVPGGDGNKNEIQVKEGNAFYDNIGRWATKHGMVGFNKALSDALLCRRSCALPNSNGSEGA